jgi:hypothetical protein
MKVAKTLRGRFVLCCLSSLLASGAPANESFELRVAPAVTDRYILVADKPAPGTGTAEIRLTAAPGEYEPASFVIYARDAINDVTVVVSDLQNAAGDRLNADNIDVRIVKRWFQAPFGGKADKKLRQLTPELLVYDDSLVKVEDGRNHVRLENGKYKLTDSVASDPGRTVLHPAEWPIRDAQALQPFALDPGTNRQMWITLHVPDEAAPGVYTGQVTVTTSGSGSAQLPLTIEVLPFRLAKPLLEYSIYYRGYLDTRRPDGSISSEIKSDSQYLADLRNMKAHGIANPTIYQKHRTGLIDRVLGLYEEAGLKPERLYYLGLNIVSNNKGNVPRSLGRIVDEVNAKATAAGIGQVYFYARDEARDEELSYQLPFWEEARRHGGKVMAAGWQTDATRLGNFDVTHGNEDLFICLGSLRESESARWHSKSRLIYSYQNPTGGYEIPETYRLNYGLLLWQFGYDGAMPYAYQDGGGSVWNDFDSDRHRDFNFTYPALDRPIDTIQWEGLREGVDDVRYLSTLLGMLESADTEKAAGVRSWLNQLRAAPLGKLDLDAVRQALTAHILYLSDAADAQPPDLPISSLHTRRDAGGVELKFDQSLQGWWRFNKSNNGEAEDLSQWGRTAQLYGDAVVSDGALILDGDADFVTADGIEIPEDGTGTVEGWFWFEEFAMDKRASFGLFSGIYQHASNNHFYIAGTNEQLPVSSLLRLRTWHHIVISWDGDSSTVMAYVDGRPVPVVPAGEIEEVREIDDLIIGRARGYLGGLIRRVKGTFSGRIADVRVWNRVLTEAEVHASYNAGSAVR